MYHIYIYVALSLSQTYLFWSGLNHILAKIKRYESHPSFAASGNRLVFLYIKFRDIWSG